jgi:hypothetical protein
MKRTAAIVVVAGAALLTACSTDATPPSNSNWGSTASASPSRLPDETSTTVMRAALQSAWDQAGGFDQGQMCDGARALGFDWAASKMSSPPGQRVAITPAAAEAFLRSKCLASPP